VIVWPLSRAIYQDLSGIGDLKYQARWNEAELPIVYASASLALA
jgi:RES domain-containing protein